MKLPDCSLLLDQRRRLFLCNNNYRSLFVRSPALWNTQGRESFQSFDDEPVRVIGQPRGEVGVRSPRKTSKELFVFTRHANVGEKSNFQF